jgi:hypothetical protein
VPYVDARTLAWGGRSPAVLGRSWACGFAFLFTAGALIDRWAGAFLLSGRRLAR